MKNDKSILYGLLAGTGLLLFYILIVSLFQDINFAFVNLRSLWYLIFPLAAGFGTQIGLYTSIKHTALMKGTVAGTGGFSAGSMIVCCSHFLFNMLPFLGASALAVFLMKYQPAFLGAGILSNFIGIGIMIKHKRKMRENIKFPLKHNMHLKGGKCHNG